MDAPLKASRDPTPAPAPGSSGSNSNKNKKKKRSRRDQDDDDDNNNDDDHRDMNGHEQHRPSQRKPYSNNNSNNKKQRSSLEGGGGGGRDGRCSVFVGNLAFETSWQDLKDHMRNSDGKTPLEVVHADILQQGRRSKGCGVVQFATPQQAQQAIRFLNQTELQGREIFVQEYESKSNDNENNGNNNGNSKNPYNGNRDTTTTTNNSSSSNNGPTLYIGNLPWDASWQDLKDYVRSQLGPGNLDIRRADIPQNAQGRPAGFGLVELATAQQAERAISVLDGAEFRGRKLYVKLDEKQQQQQQQQQGPPSRNGHSNNNSNNNSTNNSNNHSANRVYVGNLRYETSWQQVKDHMRRAGNVDRAELLTHAASHPKLAGKSKGCAIVTYQNPREAQRAVQELHDSVLDGRPLLVRPDRED